MNHDVGQPLAVCCLHRGVRRLHTGSGGKQVEPVLHRAVERRIQRVSAHRLIGVHIGRHELLPNGQTDQAREAKALRIHIGLQADATLLFCLQLHLGAGGIQLGGQTRIVLIAGAVEDALVVLHLRLAGGKAGAGCGQLQVAAAHGQHDQVARVTCV